MGVGATDGALSHSFFPCGTRKAMEVNVAKCKVLQMGLREAAEEDWWPRPTLSTDVLDAEAA